MAIEGFSDRPRHLRDRHDYRVPLMAGRTGIPERTLDKYIPEESGSLPGSDAVSMIASGLDVSLDWLVSGAETAADDAGRIVRLCARAGAVKVLEIIAESDGSGKGWPADEWARTIA